MCKQATHIMPFPYSHCGEPDPRREVLARIGCRWVADAWRRGRAVLTDDAIDQMDARTWAQGLRCWKCRGPQRRPYNGPHLRRWAVRERGPSAGRKGIVFLQAPTVGYGDAIRLHTQAAVEVVVTVGPAINIRCCASDLVFSGHSPSCHNWSVVSRYEGATDEI
jgi:hypothetical protein